MNKSEDIFEAEKNIYNRNRAIILGVGVDSTSRDRVLRIIFERCSNKAFVRPLFIVTAYSENIMECSYDKGLGEAMEKADLVVADGVSTAAAADYLKRRKGRILDDLWQGLVVGGRILQGRYVKNQIVGVDLTKSLLRAGGERGWKIFLLGGWNGVAEKVAKMMSRDFPEIKIEWDEGDLEVKSQTNYNILKKINDFGPDILLVAYGRFKQEKWIAGNLDRLRVKVVMGVGSSFDELAAVGPWATPTPPWVSRMGLKWLWRGLRSPKNTRRAWNAFPVFAWKVFKSQD